MSPNDLDILSDAELDDLMTTSPKAAMAYMKLLNALVRQTAAAPAIPVASATPQVASALVPSAPQPLGMNATPFPDPETVSRIEVTIWDNADDEGRRPKGQTRYKAQIQAYVGDCEGVHAPRFQWKRSVFLYEKWTFTGKFEKLTLTPDYLQVLNHLVDAGSSAAHYAMLYDKAGGTNYYDRQVLMFDMAGKQVANGLLWIGDDGIELPPFVNYQAGQERLALNKKIVGQSRWSRDDSGWSTAISSE